MKEYTITMNFLVESDNADYEQISEFAEQLAEGIMENDKLIYQDDIEVIDISVHEVIDDNHEEDNLYLREEDDE